MRTMKLFPMEDVLALEHAISGLLDQLAHKSLLDPSLIMSVRANTVVKYVLTVSPVLSSLYSGIEILSLINILPEQS